MSSFVPRTTIPSNTDKHWIKTTYGGYNRCILGSPSYGTGSVLANCVGYAWGRWLEIHGTTDCNLSRGDGATWWGYNDGYSRGQTPRLGAVACWSGGPSGEGHVAIVEDILANGTIKCSESAYGSYFFYYQTYTGNYNWTGSTGALYSFQGFIYPTISFEDDWLYTYLANKKKKIKVVIS